jgi:glycosyltransferase involved in cell wall biosynthesis
MSNSIHVIGSKMSGGAERFYARLANSLSEQSEVLAVNPPGSPVSKLIDVTVNQRHPKMMNNYGIRSMLQIKRAAKTMGPCIVQSYMGRATRLTHISPSSGMVHLARLGGYYKLKAYRHAHHLLGNTKGICEYLLKEGVPSKQVHYIGNFVDPLPSPPQKELDQLRESLKIPKEAFIITCAARFHENKGIPDLLNALQLLIQKKLSRPIRLILVGNGPMQEEINQQIQHLGLENEVIMPGWCDPAPYYHLADVITCPSRHEPLGNVILEAWASKKPLVATQSQGAMELAEHANDAWLTPLKDPKGLAEGLEIVLKDDELRTSLATNGYLTVLNRFSKEVITAQYMELYQQLLSRV